VAVPKFDVLSRHSLGSADKITKTLKLAAYRKARKPSSGSPWGMLNKQVANGEDGLHVTITERTVLNKQSE
jgi:hypothetical protein